MTTVAEIKKTLDRRFKPVTYRQVVRYVQAAGVKPIGRRTRPLVFPDDAVKKVIRYLQVPETKIPSMKQLLAIKHRSQKARGR